MMNIEDRCKVIRTHLERAKINDRKEEKTNIINQQLTGMIEEILDYIQFGEGNFEK